MKSELERNQLEKVTLPAVSKRTARLSPISGQSKRPSPNCTRSSLLQKVLTSSLQRALKIFKIIKIKFKIWHMPVIKKNKRSLPSSPNIPHQRQKLEQAKNKHQTLCLHKYPVKLRNSSKRLTSCKAMKSASPI
jgi:hypothetical protein